MGINPKKESSKESQTPKRPPLNTAKTVPHKEINEKTTNAGLNITPQTNYAPTLKII
jgi:hypothetical protein